METGEKAERYGHASDCFDYAMVYYLAKEYSKYKGNLGNIVTTISPNETVYGEFVF